MSGSEAADDELVVPDDCLPVAGRSWFVGSKGGSEPCVLATK